MVRLTCHEMTGIEKIVRYTHRSQESTYLIIVGQEGEAGDLSQGREVAGPGKCFYCGFFEKDKARQGR